MEIRTLDQVMMREIYQRYMVNDFPKAELKPFDAIMQLQEKGVYHCYGYFDGDELLAYAYFIGDSSGWQLLDYYAVCIDKRSKGLGSQFLQSLAQKLKNTLGIFAEIESLKDAKTEEEENIRHRRRDFYYRNGWQAADVYCILFGVGFDILYLPLAGTTLTPEEAKIQLGNVYRLMLPEKFFNEQVKLFA